MIYSFAIFDPHGVCLYYKEYPCVSQSKNNPNDWKLLYGLLLTVKNFVAFMAPRMSAVLAIAVVNLVVLEHLEGAHFDACRHETIKSIASSR